MPKQNILLIQPHSDDILFSASKYLFERNEFGKVKILTIESGNEKRVSEDKELCDYFDVKYASLGYKFEDDSYYHYYKTNTVFDSSKCMEVLKDRYGKKFLNQIKEDLIDEVNKYKKANYKIIVCLGIGHPMHFFIRECIKDLADLFYRDFPHSYKRKTKVDFQNCLSEFVLKTEWYGDDEYHQAKFDIAYQIYKTQRSLLFFEKGYIDKKIPEQFYKLKK